MITIIIPTLNSSRYIAETLDSIYNQFFLGLEVIVVDGFSSDNTLEILNNHPLTLTLFQIKGSMYKAIDFGISKSKNNILTWLNSDDILLKECLNNIIFIFKDISVNWVIGKESYLIENRFISYPLRYYNSSFILKKKYYFKSLGFIQQEGIFFKKDLYLKSGGLDLSLKFSSDFFLWVKFSMISKPILCDFETCAFRIHYNSLSKLNFNYYILECNSRSSFFYNFFGYFIFKKSNYYTKKNGIISLSYKSLPLKRIKFKLWLLILYFKIFRS